VTAAIEQVGSVDVPRWAGAVAECVSALERVAYAAPALAGRGKPPPRAALPPGASAGEVERRWAGPLYGRDAVSVVGRGSVVGRELVGWVAADDGEEGAGGGGRRWLSGVFPVSARDIAARFTERVLRPSGEGWLHACVGAVVAGHASLLMDEDEVGEWEPLPEVPAYPLVSARVAWGDACGCRCMHMHVCCWCVDAQVEGGVDVVSLWRMRVWGDAVAPWGKPARAALGRLRAVVRRARVASRTAIVAGLTAEPVMPRGPALAPASARSSVPAGGAGAASGGAAGGAGAASGGAPAPVPAPAPAPAAGATPAGRAAPAGGAGAAGGGAGGKRGGKR
jgi:hypothetical protein